MSARKTVDLTTSLRPHPAFFNFASMFERTTWSGPLRLREPLRSEDRNQPDPRRRREAPRRRLPNMEAHRAREDRFVRSWFSAATSGRGINSLAIRWHMDGIASRADVTADYVLSKLPNGRTQLDLRWRRRPRMSGLKQPTKAQREASTLVAWKRFGAAMERDYRRGRGPRSHRKR